MLRDCWCCCCCLFSFFCCCCCCYCALFFPFAFLCHISLFTINPHFHSVHITTSHDRTNFHHRNSNSDSNSSSSNNNITLKRNIIHPLDRHTTYVYIEITGTYTDTGFTLILTLCLDTRVQAFRSCVHTFLSPTLLLSLCLFHFVCY